MLPVIWGTTSVGSGARWSAPWRRKDTCWLLWPPSLKHCITWALCSATTLLPKQSSGNRFFSQVHPFVSLHTSFLNIASVLIFLQPPLWSMRSICKSNKIIPSGLLLMLVCTPHIHLLLLWHALGHLLSYFEMFLMLGWRVCVGWCLAVCMLWMRPSIFLFVGFTLVAAKVCHSC